jgi:hypothetical protein
METNDAEPELGKIWSCLLSAKVISKALARPQQPFHEALSEPKTKFPRHSGATDLFLERKLHHHDHQKQGTLHEASHLGG